ncbi:MAG: peroxiredoxin family protein [Haloferacaceae archaeon]
MSLEGSQAPSFELPSTAGDEVSLEDRLADGPAVVLINRGYWCSFCAEQLNTFDEVAYDLWFNDGVDVLPVVTSSLGRLREMRDRFDWGFQLLADPEGEVAEQYSGVEETSHGLTGVAGTYVVDTDGVVRYEQVADHPADRTYGNWVRYFIRDDAGEAYENPFA